MNGVCLDSFRGVFLKILLSFVGFTVAGFGVALTIHSNLGTTPISSIPFITSRIIPPLLVGSFEISFSVGVMTFLLNFLFFLFQLVVYRKNFPLTQWFQLLAVAWFGACIDWGGYLCANLGIESYLLQILAVVLGSAMLAFGIMLELVADVVYLPGEGMVATLNLFLNLKFGTMKIIFDFSQVIIASFISYSVLYKLIGVREGTLLSALLVGWFIKCFSSYEKYLKKTFGFTRLEQEQIVSLPVTSMKIETSR